jgi:phenylacetate-CoA ligase
VPLRTHLPAHRPRHRTHRRHDHRPRHQVFPSQIEHALLKIEGTQPYYQLIVDRKAGGMDDLEVLVEVELSFFSDKISKLEALAADIRRSCTKRFSST